MTEQMESFTPYASCPRKSSHLCHRNTVSRSRLAEVFCKGPDNKYFRLWCHAFSAALVTSQYCCCGMKAVIGNVLTSGHACGPIKLYLQKQIG